MQFLYKEALEKDEPPMHPIRLASEVDRFLGDDGVLVVDGARRLSGSVGAKINRPGRMVCYGYLGCLGTGIPSAWREDRSSGEAGARHHRRWLPRSELR